ncbi:MAG: hypothetical protein K0V04_18840 [Deltaproteobacteria bacterium]|nr:hypothetical protein [Deltaproteobacteria bacterium]
MSDAEREVYLALERGRAVSPGPETAAHQAAHARIVGVLGQLGEDKASGDEAWMDEVLASSAPDPAPRPRSDARHGWVMVMAVAAAAILSWVLRPPPRGSDSGSSLRAAIEVSVTSPDGIRGRVAVGSTVTVTVPDGVDAPEIRVYRAGQALVARCRADQCQRTERGLTLTFVVARPGRYRPVVLRGGAQEGRSATGALGPDLRAAKQAGATIRQAEPVEVL